MPWFWRFFGVFSAVFWRFFGRLEDDAVLRLPLDRIAPNSVSWAFASHSTGIQCWKGDNIIISRFQRFGRFFGVFSAVSKTTLSCAYPLTELHQTRFLGLLQAIPPESSVGKGIISLLADFNGLGAFLALFCGRLDDDAVLGLPIDRIEPNLVSWAFVDIPPEWRDGNGKTSLLTDFHGFGVFLRSFAVSKTKLSCAYPLTELHQTRILGLLQAILPESSVGKVKTLLLPDCHGFGAFLALFWHFFGAFSAVSKTTLYCAYPLTELHQTRFLGLLQAKSPESSIGNGKTLILADCHGFRVFLALFRPSRRQRCPALTPGPNCTKLGFLGFCRPFHRNRPLETGKHHYEQIATVLAFFWHFFSRLEDDAVLRLPID